MKPRGALMKLQIDHGEPGENEAGKEAKRDKKRLLTARVSSRNLLYYDIYELGISNSVGIAIISRTIVTLAIVIVLPSL